MQHDAQYEEYPRHHGRHGNGSSGYRRDNQEREYAQDDYASMYDDGPRDDTHPQRHDDVGGATTRIRPGEREQDEPQHRPRSGGRYRSRSRSPGRDAGRPSDTVILEGLPRTISQNEVRFPRKKRHQDGFPGPLHDAQPAAIWHRRLAV